MKYIAIALGFCAAASSAHATSDTYSEEISPVTKTESQAVEIKINGIQSAQGFTGRRCGRHPVGHGNWEYSCCYYQNDRLQYCD